MKRHDSSVDPNSRFGGKKNLAWGKVGLERNHSFSLSLYSDAIVKEGVSDEDTGIAGLSQKGREPVCFKMSYLQPAGRAMMYGYVIKTTRSGASD